MRALQVFLPDIAGQTNIQNEELLPSLFVYCWFYAKFHHRAYLWRFQFNIQLKMQNPHCWISFNLLPVLLPRKSSGSNKLIRLLSRKSHFTSFKLSVYVYALGKWKNHVLARQFHQLMWSVCWWVDEYHKIFIMFWLKLSMSFWCKTSFL